PMTAATSESEVLRFKREADAAAALKHPGVLPVYGWGRDVEQRVFWLAQALVDGRSYDQLVKAQEGPGGAWKGREPVARAARVVAAAARALAHAHERGVVHRDVKPSNIMLERERVFV